MQLPEENAAHDREADKLNLQEKLKQAAARKEKLPC